MRSILKKIFDLINPITVTAALVLFLVGCESIKVHDDLKPDAPTPVASPTPVAKPSPTPASSKLAWGNADWDAKLRGELVEEGLDQVQSIADAETFCPRYGSLTASQRLEFWSVLMVAMAKRESNYKPATTYQEAFKNSKGEWVISTGLFQISWESTRQSKYKCPGVTTESLKNPMQNIGCSVNILAHWVKTDKRAAGYSGSNTGCGRYWAVCRPGSSQTYIASQTNALPFCKK